jgi:murein DD-endopeptidase MepM/ murein hydrolase activator NlpD
VTRTRFARRALFALFPGVVLLSSASAASNPALEIRFCPSAQVRTYPADSTRNVQSLVLQNLLVRNRSDQPLEVTGVDIELLKAGLVTDKRVVEVPTLQDLSRASAEFQASGGMELIAFQFCGADMIPKGTKLSGPRLEPGQAVLIMQQPFVFKGEREALRVTARATNGNQDLIATASLPVLSTPSRTRFRFPLAGAWSVVVGPTLHTAHRWALPEEFGFDIVRLGQDMATHRAEGTRFEDYHAYASPVMAAARGRVIGVSADVPEDVRALRAPAESEEDYGRRIEAMQMALLAKGGTAAAGNFVLIDHGQSEYSLYAHLKPDSVRVKVGDEVQAGQPIAQLGSSGNSTEPHLHFQVCDRPAVLACAGIPIEFEGITLPFADAPRALQSGDTVISRDADKTPPKR